MSDGITDAERMGKMTKKERQEWLKYKSKDERLAEKEVIIKKLRAKIKILKEDNRNFRELAKMQKTDIEILQGRESKFRQIINDMREEGEYCDKLEVAIHRVIRFLEQDTFYASTDNSTRSVVDDLLKQLKELVLL